VVLQELTLAVFGLIFLTVGSAVAILRGAVSKGHQKWMQMIAGERGRQAAERITPGTWLATGLLFAIVGAAVLFASLNLLLRH
jgi:hypothetical protein